MLLRYSSLEGDAIHHEPTFSGRHILSFLQHKSSPVENKRTRIVSATRPGLPEPALAAGSAYNTRKSPVLLGPQHVVARRALMIVHSDSMVYLFQTF